MQEWDHLKKCLDIGSFREIDLLFAARVLKTLGSTREDHAALLAVLFALSSQGHLTVDISPGSLEEVLQSLQIEDVEKMANLVRHGAWTFPPQGIADTPEGVPSSWICRRNSHYYLQKNWVSESKILTHIHRLHSAQPAIPPGHWIPDPRLNAAQQEAVAKAAQSSIFLLSGGPGTGKTFTASMLANALSREERKQFRIIVTAPTGKAVAQLEGSLRKLVTPNTEIVSGTLHALLRIRPWMEEQEVIPGVIQELAARMRQSPGIEIGGGGDSIKLNTIPSPANSIAGAFTRPGSQFLNHSGYIPLLADIILVDECSMIDVSLFSRLLESVPAGTRLILIGDPDQLPPVEAGSAFADLLESNIFPGTHLIEVLRSDRTEILTLARHIREGNTNEALALPDVNTAIDWTDPEEIPPSRQLSQLWDHYNGRFLSFFSREPEPAQILETLEAFGILSCMRQGPLGVDAVNRYFLERYETLMQGSCRKDRAAFWVVPVIITRNDYDLELFNGDLGMIVRSVSTDCSWRSEYALFRNRRGGHRKIHASVLTSFEYGYCLSVHKSQGSEYDEVGILFPPGSEQFGREVLYTAVTRARKKVSLWGSRELLERGIGLSSRKRSGIAERLRG